jgi:hypothetical protein
MYFSIQSLLVIRYLSYCCINFFILAAKNFLSADFYRIFFIFLLLLQCFLEKKDPKGKKEKKSERMKFESI